MESIPVHIMDLSLLPYDPLAWLTPLVGKEEAQRIISTGRVRLCMHPALGPFPKEWNPHVHLRLYRYRGDMPNEALQMGLVTVFPADGDADDARDYITGWLALVPYEVKVLGCPLEGDESSLD